MKVIKGIAYTGVSGETWVDYNLKIINVVGIVATTIALIYWAFYGFMHFYFGGDFKNAFYTLCFMLPIFPTVFIFTKKRMRRFAASLLSIGGIMATVGLTIIAVEPELGIHYFALGIPGLVLLMLNRKSDIALFTFYSLLAISGFWYCEYIIDDPLFPSFPADFDFTYWHMNSSIMTALFIMLSVYIFASDLNVAREKIEDERDRANKLLLNILPESIAVKLQEDHRVIADGFANTSIMFADMVGFTKIAALYQPAELVALLNTYFTEYDNLTDRYKLEKIKTIGDAYMVASGIPEPADDHANRIAEFGIKMLEVTQRISKDKGVDITLRIGINSGPVTAGVIGKKKFIYDLWGDAVNVAARMESHGVPNKIQVTESTYKLLKDYYNFEHRGEISVKGKGNIHAYILEDEKRALLV